MKNKKLAGEIMRAIEASKRGFVTITDGRAIASNQSNTALCIAVYGSASASAETAASALSELTRGDALATETLLDVCQAGEHDALAAEFVALVSVAAQYADENRGADWQARLQAACETLSKLEIN